MTIVEGKFGISARVLCDSISPAGIRLMTYEIQYPRIILAELNTHGQLAKNSASSRAIPFTKMTQQLTGRPVRFGQANPGMQDKGEDYDAPVYGKTIHNYNGWGDYTPAYTPEEAWEKAREDALFWSEAFYKAGYAKQIYNRQTEAYQMMKTVLSGTELENFFWLRKDAGAADPSIYELARVMYEARDASEPMVLNPGEWHTPYVNRARNAEGVLLYFDINDDGSFTDYSLQDAIKISAARSAAVSFRNVDYGLDKCLEVHERLVGDERKHASAFEHQCTPVEPLTYSLERRVNLPEEFWTWQEGVSHVDRDGQLWSGRMRGFIQYRKLIPGECYTGK